MTPENVPDFEIRTDLPAPTRRALGASMEDRVMGLRTRLEYSHIQATRHKQDQAQLQKRTLQNQQRMLLDVIRIADSMEDVLRMFRENKKLRKQSDALSSFNTTYQTLLHVLESWSVYPVELVGKTYKTVAFQGVPVPEPWTVVDAHSPGVAGGPLTCKEVIRGLWVWICDGRLYVLRKGQVVC